MSLLSHTSTRSRRGLDQADSSFDNRGRQQRPSFFADLFTSREDVGSHMSLDTESHWRWNNLVNLLPALVLLFILLVGIML